jgi:hypothetical protein
LHRPAKLAMTILFGSKPRAEIGETDDRETLLLNDSIRESPVYPPSQKYSHFPFYPTHLHIHCRLVPHEGRLAIVTDAGRDAVDAGSSGARTLSQGRPQACERSSGARTNDVARGRRSRVVLTPRRWRQGGGRRLLPNRAHERCFIPPAKVAIKPGHLGEHEGNR